MDMDLYFHFHKDKKDEFIDLLRKYNVGCKGSLYPCVGIYTFKRGFYIPKGDVIFHFKMNEEDFLKDDGYTIGLKLFEFMRVEREVAARLFMLEGDSAIQRIMLGFAGENDRAYKDYQYLRYKMYEALPFTNEEYYFIRDLEQFDLVGLEDDLIEEGEITLSDLLDYEEVSFEAVPPEKEYIDRINYLFALINSELEDYAQFPEDERLKVIKLDLSLIKKELKELAEDNGLTIKVNAKGLELEIFNKYTVIKPLYMKELKEFYNYYYEDNEDFKLKLARELQMKETNGYY